jgi:threonine dehydratase
VAEAAARIADAVIRTPLVSSERLNMEVGAELVLKAETLQRTGSFKIRGATNAIRSLGGSPDRPAGVVAFSSGNHAQAVASAAREAAIPATILMPEDAPQEKLDATRRYGADIVTFDRYTEDREERAAMLAQELGFIQVPPYDDTDVIAGQGTVALELFQEAGPLDALLVPVGGGGLIAGSGVVAEELSRGCRVIGAEPTASGDTRRSLATGNLVREAAGPTIADGQQAPQGRLTFALMRRRVEQAVLVTDEEIAAAMRLLFDAVKLVTEPSGACALAAARRHVDALGLHGSRVGVVLSGSNVALERFAAIAG